jgi:protocatechuate 4,5-dioxygenase alpha chain
MYGKMSSPPMTFDEFQEMMINGGRPIDGNRSKREIDNG